MLCGPGQREPAPKFRTLCGIHAAGPLLRTVPDADRASDAKIREKTLIDRKPERLSP